MFQPQCIDSDGINLKVHSHLHSSLQLHIIRFVVTEKGRGYVEAVE